VGLRLRRGNDFPYLGARGFAQLFVDAESSLLAPDEPAPGSGALECACGAVASGRCSPAMPFITPAGTFWTNQGAEGPDGSRSLRQVMTRGRCFREGYHSVAIARLRVGESTLGLLHLADQRPGLLDPHALARIERVAETVAGVLARLKTQEAHQESEGRFRTLLENSSVVSLIYQRKQVIYGNPAMDLTFGVLPDGSSFRELRANVHPEDEAAFDQLCEELDLHLARTDDLAIRFVLPDLEAGIKRLRWFKFQSSPIGFRGNPAVLVELVDITRLKELEHAVAVRERLASLGHMAAGIAHEIRNPLSGINLNVSALGLLCQRSEGLAPDERERIEAVLAQIKAASEKTASVIRRVMEFSKPSPPRMDRIDVSHAVREALALCSTAARKHGIELVERFPAGPLFCHADPALMEQVVLNLLNNAIQAMAEGGHPGLLSVTLSQEDARAVVRVADSGPGVPSHLRERIFEPFFTTKKDGHGIGLSFSHRIVADHGGRLSVGPSESGGAEFRVELPLES
jgi:signal transduction histidine kinase